MMRTVLYVDKSSLDLNLAEQVINVLVNARYDVVYRAGLEYVSEKDLKTDIGIIVCDDSNMSLLPELRARYPAIPLMTLDELLNGSSVSALPERIKILTTKETGGPSCNSCK